MATLAATGGIVQTCRASHLFLHRGRERLDVGEGEGSYL